MGHTDDTGGNLGVVCLIRRYCLDTKYKKKTYFVGHYLFALISVKIVQDLISSAIFTKQLSTLP